MEGLDRLSALRNELTRRLGSQRYELLVGSHTSLECVAGTLRVGSPSQFQLQWLRRRLHDTLKGHHQTGACWRHPLRIAKEVNAPERGDKANPEKRRRQEAQGHGPGEENADEGPSRPMDGNENLIQQKFGLL